VQLGGGKGKGISPLKKNLEKYTIQEDSEVE
jgi:hypothetical protein